MYNPNSPVQIALDYNGMTYEDLAKIDSCLLEMMAEDAYGKEDYQASDELSALADEKRNPDSLGLPDEADVEALAMDAGFDSFEAMQEAQERDMDDINDYWEMSGAKGGLS